MKKQWWHDKIAYQIYPKSFLDTNHDGIGDLRGVITKLDYLKELGIDIIWLSPIYQSPFVDQGYDISDYYKIAPEFGTMEDFDELLAEAKKRDMYIVMDLVINHCSDKHEWFQKALADPDGEYGQYFYIREGKGDNPPSNYRSYFGGSAWEKIEGTNRYYLHMFAREQPDLNWENPKVKDELFTMINWWLEKGLAGFRIDAIINIKKDLSFPDFAPDGPDGLSSVTCMVHHVKGVGDLLLEMKEKTFAKYDAFTVAEVFDVKESEKKNFVGDNGYFSTMFDFSAHILTYGKHGWYDAEPIEFTQWRDTLFSSQLGWQDSGFLANIIENHDEPRGASTYLPEYAQNEDGIKMLGTVSVLMRGIPFIYQGQEIGMRNCPMADISEYDDISTLDQYHLAIEAGCSKEDALKACYHYSRDNARTPMQWDENRQAGFTDGSPWLKVNPNYKTINVQKQTQETDSVLNYYKKLTALRKSEQYKELFTYGDFEPVYPLKAEEKLFAYHRVLNGKKILVAANFGEEEITLTLEKQPSRILLSNQNRTEAAQNLTLKPCEVIVLA